ncbi:SDR family NAD(P)-dependent oxidoreductase [Halobellus sp. GM3]|uniref:SDR family NAD(P)-dependent oxidoreductase n=1 Tax=Halobellus sp. GM3 TaxID=3458410 RepID=UPI00403D598D
MDGTVHIVTGGTGGLGGATARELADNGATVVINDLPAKDSEAASLAREIREGGGTAATNLGDVTDVAYAESLVDSVVDEHGRLDSVVNYAGVIRDGYLTDMSEDEWQQVTDVHLRGHFGLLRSAATHWQRNAEDRTGERAFVCVTSPAALGNVGQANYATAKAGVLGLTRTAAAELDQFGVRVNALLPIAYTAMTESFLDPEEYPPEKVAPVAAFLASEKSAGVSGCTVRAAGDSVGLLSNPELERVAFNDGGWEVDDLEAEIESVFGDAENRSRTNPQR